MRFLFTEWEGHFPIATLVLVGVAVHDAKEFPIFPGEARFVVLVGEGEHVVIQALFFQRELIGAWGERQLGLLAFPIRGVEGGATGDDMG